jgi:hypothetical protein
MSEAEERFLKILRVLQIVHGAMFMGPLLALAILLLLLHQQGRSLTFGADPPLFTLIALVFLLTMVPLSFVLTAVSIRAGVQRIAGGTWQAPRYEEGRTMNAPFTDAEKLMFIRQTANIIGIALLEGATFFSVITVFLDGHVAALVAAAVGLGLILLRFPTEGRIRAWLDEQGDRLTQLRQEQPPAGPAPN